MVDAGAALPHLDDGIVSEILCRLPSKNAYSLAAVCRQWRAVLSQTTFLCRHLSPRPLPLLDDRPHALIIQPRRKVGFSHLKLVAVDSADHVPVNVPVQPKYTDPVVPARHGKNLAPPPDLFDIAKDKSVFRLLDPDGADDLGDADPEEVDDDDDDDDDNVLAELPNLPTPPVSSDLLASTVTEASAAEDPTPPLLPLDDYVVFFERTVPMLGISVVASHGRLLLCRSRSRYYVCDPAANRWLALPSSTISPSSGTNSGLYWDFDAYTGLLALTVVLLVRRRRGRVLVDTFSSATGRWDTTELAAPSAARCLPAVSPGIHVGTCFYWLGRRWRDTRHVGYLLCYDAARCRVSVLREPPLAKDGKSRTDLSLGSVGGKLRLCAFDIRDESMSMRPHEGVEGVHCVWLMDVVPAWRCVHEATVDDLWAYHFLMLFGLETPVDFASACSELIFVVKGGRLSRHDLESGSRLELYRTGSSGRLDNLYDYGYNVFPFFK